MNRKQRRARGKGGSAPSPAGTPLFAEAVRHHQAGRLGDAERLYRRILEMDPRHADSLHLLGVLSSQAGRHDEAVGLIDGAISLRPDYPEAHHTLGNVLRQQGRLDEAVAAWRRAIALRPDYPEAHHALGAALRLQGRLDEAAAGCRRALALRPDFPEACHTLGNVLRQQGRLDEAAASYRRAIALRPDYTEPCNNLGIVLTDLGRLDEAEACCRRAVALDPRCPEAHNSLGLALNVLGRPDEAGECYRRAIALRPTYPEAHNNLGVVLWQRGRADEAEASYRRALDLDPNHGGAHTNLAITLLARGDLAAGWAEYEWRWTVPQLIGERRGFARPQWLGEAAAGRTLLIHAEQGLGDTLQFCRYAPLAAARGLRVVLEVPTPLVRLMHSLPGVDAVVERGAELPDFDLHCPLLSLPLAMGTTLETIAGPPGYLRADEGQAAAWRARLAAMPGRGPRVGLAWAGNPHPRSPSMAATDRRRSLAPRRLAPLSDLPGLHFVSLQKDGPAMSGVTDVMAEMADFADTAALVANLDLVISVDTATAHLAGALGKPVWLLDRFDSDWRWLRGRDDSPWYPTLRLFRQPEPGNWDAVIDRVAAELRSGAIGGGGLASPP